MKIEITFSNGGSSVKLYDNNSIYKDTPIKTESSGTLDFPDLDSILASAKSFMRPYFPIEKGGSKL